MLSQTVFLLALGACCAASMEKRQGVPVAESRGGSHHSGGGGHSAPAASMEKSQGVPVAESRDGAHHGGGGGGGHSAPAAAPASDQGNLYYYYYPVQEYGSSEASGGDFDIFTAIILPLLILGGLLLLLSSLTFTLTTGRAMSEEKQEPQLMEQLHDEIERVFYAYLKSFESEECIARTVCEMGAYSKNLEGSKFVLGFVEPLVPEGMKGNMAIFKKAALSGQETGKCKKYRCKRPKLI